ncbi:cell division protein FtsQ [Candidatus Magnetomorum sp. HK-1]|nr:cell division protein FtsQ [Candidatus Magnetomorum sp. HK-1]
MHNQMLYNKYTEKKPFKFKGPVVFTVLMVAVSLMCIFVYDLLITLPYFQTKDIQVTGQNFLSKNNILECANLTLTENILGINLNKIHKLLIQNPWVISASIRRKFPNELFIKIVEKQALAILMIDRPLIVDTKGYIIKEQTESDPQKLPIVTGMTYADLSPSDEPLSQKMSSILHVLTEKKQMIAFPKNMDIFQLHVDMDFGITIWIGDPGIEILLGSENYRKKFHRLRKLLAFFRYRKAYQRIEYIDMNNLDRITVRPYSEKNSDGKEV